MSDMYTFVQNIFNKINSMGSNILVIAAIKYRDE